jgi:branched-chain amino acid transport system substrate-binding protein
MAIGWREVGVGSSEPVDECWRVGVLFSQTGNTAVIEETQLCGTVLAIEEINATGGLNGRECVPVIYDPTSNCENFARYADKLLTEDGVGTVFGCYTSSSRKVVLPVFERRNGCCGTRPSTRAASIRPTSDAIFSTAVDQATA